jgi:hypothetical protein
MDTSEQRWNSGQEPTKYSYFNKVVNEECAKSVAGLPQKWIPQKEVADANKLGFIQYEGGNHDVLYAFNSLEPEERTRFMEFYKECNHTPEDAANYATMFTAFEKFGGKHPAKFVEFGPVSRYGAWGGLRHFKDKNPVWDAVVKFNGRK